MELCSGVIAPLLLFGETLRFANEVFILARHGVMDAGYHGCWREQVIRVGGAEGFEMLL